MSTQVLLTLEPVLCTQHHVLGTLSFRQSFGRQGTHFWREDLEPRQLERPETLKKDRAGSCSGIFLALVMKPEGRAPVEEDGGSPEHPRVTSSHRPAGQSSQGWSFPERWHFQVLTHLFLQRSCGLDPAVMHKYGGSGEKPRNVS